MKSKPYSLLVDGSNDTGREKLNPLTVKLYDFSSKQVTTQLLDMCTTTGRNCGTAAAIFEKIDSVLSDYEIPWSNCIGFGVDNTSVNIGIRNSIMTRVKEKNDVCYFMGCPCHLIHNIACHASEAFQKAGNIDVEDLCIDLYYWFEKSNKRKGILAEFCDFCDNDYHEIVRHVNVRWLSLEKAVNRVLQLYPSLESYFKSENESQARFGRLLTAFEDPMTEVYLFFYQSVLPTFTSINLLLQQEYPNIFLVAKAIRRFLKQLLSKFVTIRAIKASADITEVDFGNTDNQLDDKNIFIGLVTKQKLQKLFNDGDISELSKKKFYKAVRLFYLDAASEALQKLPFSDSVLNNSVFVNFEEKEECVFSMVELFCEKYSDILNFTNSEMDKLQEEFVDYQLLEKRDIPESIWKEALVYEDEENDIKHYRMDVIWGYIDRLKRADNSPQFRLLCKVARLVLIIPHSNAGEERVFSLIKQNKTPVRSSLNANGTLSSLIQVKLANSTPCIAWEPPTDLLKASKTATMTYNKAHSSKKN